TVTDAQLQAATIRDVAGDHLIYAVALDAFGAMSREVRFDVSPAVNHAPSLTASGLQQMRGGAPYALSSQLHYADADGDTVATWHLWDATSEGQGAIVINGTTLATNATVTVTD